MLYYHSLLPQAILCKILFPKAAPLRLQASTTHSPFPAPALQWHRIFLRFRPARHDPPAPVPPTHRHLPECKSCCSHSSASVHTISDAAHRESLLYGKNLPAQVDHSLARTKNDSPAHPPVLNAAPAARSPALFHASDIHSGTASLLPHLRRLSVTSQKSPHLKMPPDLRIDRSDLPRICGRDFPAPDTSAASSPRSSVRKTAPGTA